MYKCGLCGHRQYSEYDCKNCHGQGITENECVSCFRCFCFQFLDDGGACDCNTKKRSRMYFGIAIFSIVIVVWCIISQQHEYEESAPAIVGAIIFGIIGCCCPNICIKESRTYDEESLLE